MTIKALALNCTLKPSTAKDRSSTEVLLGQLVAALKTHDVACETVRVVDHDVKPGVEHDMGPGDAWPVLRHKMLAADILVIGGPVWLGQPSSVIKRVLERMDAFISELDDFKRMKTFGKVALVAVVGNEDGAHHVSAEIFQALNDLGFSLPANAVTYWVGEAMGSKNYEEFRTAPEKVDQMTKVAAAAAAHLAKLLKQTPYPGIKG